MAGVPYNPLAARLFPQERTFWDKLADYGKGKAQSVFETLWGAATLPGDVYAGKIDQYAFNPQTGEVGPSPELMRRSADLAGSITLGAGAVPAVGTELGMGIRAFHGSPHDFDRFRMDRIGTGEGTQMEGHGLYFGEARDVGKFYQDSTPKEEMARIAREAAGGLHPDQQRRIIEDVVSIAKKEGHEALADYDPPRGFEKAWNAVVQHVQARGGIKGKLYKVDIEAKPDDFIDLERPVGKQSAHVRDALHRVARDVDVGVPKITDDMKPREVRALLKNPKATEKLREHGVAGIKYLDAGSKAGTSGTRNYVVFDDSIVKILRKYGIAAPVIGGTAAVGAQGEPQKPRA